jgi:RNA polymerase sigma-70 factor (family 1)
MNLYQNHSDTELIALLTEGNTEAFEVIYRKYASDLYRYARKNISVKEDCEEIVQDVFESLWTRHDELAHVTVLSAYLFRMVKYKVIRYFQHSAVKKRYAEHYLLFEAVYESSSAEEKEGSRVLSMIDKGLADLPERCRMAVKLRLTEDLSNGDIAKRMNIQKSTVENYMVTAFNHLRTLYPHLYRAEYSEN